MRTGGYDKYGFQGAEIAIEEINARGGVLGYQIEMIQFCETKNQTETCNLFRREVEAGRIQFLIGVDHSQNAVELAREAEKLEVPILISHAASADITGANMNKYVFRISNNTVQTSRAGAVYLSERVSGDWMTIGPDYNFGYSSWKFFHKRLVIEKPTCKDQYQYASRHIYVPLGTDDFKLYIDSLLLDPPENLWCSLWGDDLVNFVNQASGLGLLDKLKVLAAPVGASLTVLSKLDLDESPMPSDGFYASTRYYWDYDSEKNKEFVRKYRDRYATAGSDYRYPDYVTGETYAAVYMLVKAIRKAGSLDVEEIVKELEDDLAFEGPNGYKIIRPFDHQAVQNVIWGKISRTSEYPGWKLSMIKEIPGYIITRKRAELK